LIYNNEDNDNSAIQSLMTATEIKESTNWNYDYICKTNDKLILL